MTGESKRAVPSSSTSAGILPRGFSSLSAGTLATGVIATGTISMPSASPSSWAATRALRTNGDAGLW